MLDLRSKLRRDLLGYYFTNPQAHHYVRELAAILEVDSTNLSRELSRLEHEGLFRSDVRGRQKYFVLNPSYPLFSEVKGIVEKTVGIFPLLRTAFSTVAGIHKAYLYGSFARGEQDAQSDMDVLIVGEPDQLQLAVVVRKVEHRLAREINYVVIAEPELREKLTAGDPFLKDIFNREKLIILDEHKATADQSETGARVPGQRTKQGKRRARKSDDRS